MSELLLDASTIESWESWITLMLALYPICRDAFNRPQRKVLDE